MSTDFNLGDIPDLSVIDITGGGGNRSEPFADGWYAGKILEKREFTDSNGNDRVFESGDTVGNKSGRNIRLQVELTRKSDGRTFNVSTIVNYRPEDLTAQTVQAIADKSKEHNESGTEWGDLFRPYMALTRLAKLQKIAGVRKFQKSADGGLDITPLFDKAAYFRVKPDSRNPQYKEIADYKTDAPVKVPVL